MDLKYGTENLKLDIADDRVMKVLKANEKLGIKDPLKEIKNSLENPIATPPLLDLIEDKEPEKILIIVNDITRPTPNEYLIPPLLDVLHKAGIEKEEITFMVATGIHPPHTDEQDVEVFGKELTSNYRVISHHCDKNLVDLGKLDFGNDFLVDREVVEADFVITTGVILPHYFAGFSGGRKSILPGVAGRKTIEFNHSRMVELMDYLPPVEENPVNLEMLEGAKRAEVDFILNVVTNSNREIVKVIAGDLEQAWYSGIDTSAEMYHVPLDKQVDVTIASAGGHPRDINIYQSQKALDHADRCTKPGGTIILVAECKEGLGEDTFETWMREAKKPEDNVKRIKEKFVVGGHKAFAISKVAVEKEIIIISSLDKEMTELLFARKMNSLQQAISYVEDRYQGEYNAVIMPQGSLTVPVVKD